MGSYAALTDQSLAAQMKAISRFAAFAGVYLVLATVNGWLAFRSNYDSAKGLEELLILLMFTTLAEIAFTFVAFLYMAAAAPEPPRSRQQQQQGQDRPYCCAKDGANDKVSGSSSCAFGLVGGMLWLEAAVLVYFFLAPPQRDTSLFSFLVFSLFWLGFGVEMVFAPIAGAVERGLRARLR